MQYSADVSTGRTHDHADEFALDCDACRAEWTAETARILRAKGHSAEVAQQMADTEYAEMLADA